MTDAANAKTLVEEKERVSLGKSSDDALAQGPLAPRYCELAVLGEGGMGEVRLVRDAVIGRDVALKRVLGAMSLDALTRERFLREARVQGQLEHPSIVPVYDLAMTPDSRIFFTMRRVHGRTLHDYAMGSPKRHALLSAMSRVCLAIDFAHAHGVIHRDIKPSNVMIGDYGEVYVLDWGLAKLAGSERDPAHPSGPSVGTSGSGPQTSAGTILGTPGYMAPEQVRSEDVDVRADVYALGACLFEVLAGKPLFAIASIEAMTVAALAGANARTSERAPEREVPVELEAICVRATATNRDERFPTARAMSDAIERFLEGDRDLERRRERAREHAASARALAETALSDAKDAGVARKDAMREVGRALTNDPDNDDARRTLVQLLTAPPRTLPADVAAQMDEDRERAIVSARRFAAAAFLSTLPATVVEAWMGVFDVAWFLAGIVLVLAGAAVTILPNLPLYRARRLAVSVVGAMGIVAAARVSSPLVVVPIMALGIGVGLALFPRRTNPGLSALAAVVCLLLPFVLEWTGVLPRTFHVEADRIVIDARVMHFHAVPTMVWFFTGTATPFVATCVYVARVRDRLLEAERRVRLQAWQLRQILPDA